MAVVVAAILIKVGWDMVFTLIDELMDAQVDTETRNKIEKIVLEVGKVCSLCDLKVHKHGAEHHVDFTMTVPPELTVVESHALFTRLKRRSNEN